MRRELVFTHTLRAEDVRGMCIKMQFYTKGDCKAYSDMLNMCTAHITPETVRKIAEDIVEHTPEDNPYIAEYEPVDEVMYYLTDLIETRVQLKLFGNDDRAYTSRY